MTNTNKDKQITNVANRDKDDNKPVFNMIWPICTYIHVRKQKEKSTIQKERIQKAYNSNVTHQIHKTQLR